MKKIIFVIFAFLFVSAVQADYTYDWQTGNSYSTYQMGDTTYVRGMNLNTGSTWNTTIESDGSMRGMDSDMNPWSYSSGTGTYMNYGTGEICTGSGYSRFCY